MPLYSEGAKNRRIGTDPADHSDAAMNAMLLLDSQLPNTSQYSGKYIANHLATIIDMFFSLSNNYKREDNISHYVSDYKHIFQNVIYAIMIHNIWPSVLEKNLDTTIESEPFTYFALMCDSLQQWNRPQGLSHSLTEFKPYKAASEEYDIVVKDR